MCTKKGKFISKKYFTFQFLLLLWQVNTFQVLIVKGMDNTTFLAYLYEAVESAPRGVVGVASPLAFTYLPADRLTAQSNVGQDGRWMFKVDQPVIVECPAGRRDAPLCQQGMGV